MADNIKDEVDKINKRLDSFEEKLEEAHGQMSQDAGKSLGRDIGVLYGIIIALLVIIILMKLHII